ncbi:MAG: hypothetical protein ABIR24_11845 [Verrucomicrobiota bacterium]
MKTTLAVLSLALAGCSPPLPEQHDFKIVFPPSNTEFSDTIYLLDSKTGRLWSKSVESTKRSPDGSVETVIVGWKESNIPGISPASSKK